MACKQRAKISTAAYIIGKNDIIPIEKDDIKKIPTSQLFSTVVVATAVDEKKWKFCSGTLVPAAQDGENYRILTNHHCFADVHDSDDKMKMPESLLKTHCEKTYVFFGMVKSQVSHREMGHCLQGSFRNDYEADLAIFSLEKNPSEKFQPASFLTYDEVPANIASRVVHFPAKLSQLKGSFVFDESIGVNLPLAHLSEVDCQTQGIFDISEWDFDLALSYGFKHTCDQQKGSSGSSIWDAESNKIIGINWGGISIKYGNTGRTEIFNVATNALYALKFLGGTEIEYKKEIENKRIANTQNRSQATALSVRKVVKYCGVIRLDGELTGQFVVVILLLPLFAIRRSFND